MPLVTPDFETLRTRYLQAVQNFNPQAAVGPDSDHAVRAAGVAAVAEGLHMHIWWVFRQLFPDTADEENLVRHGSFRKVSRKAAAIASGTVSISGAPGATVSIGLQLQASSGALYEVSANTVVGGGGSVNVAASALLGGPDGNLAPGASLILINPGVGLFNDAAVVTMDGGTAVESIASFRARVIDAFRDPPGGGNEADYKRWAREVPGVDRAFVFGTRRGANTVDVAIMTESGLPGSGLLSQVQAYISEPGRKPITAGLLVLAPSLVVVNVQAQVVLSGVSLATAQASAQAALAAYFATLKPGDPVRMSRVSAAIQSVPGVDGVTLVLPASNVATTVNASLLQLASLGSVTLTI